MDGQECAGFRFYSNFDSGNLHYVGLTPMREINTKPNNMENPEIEFNILTKPDCAGTIYENGYRTWFHFAVKAPFRNQLVKFNIVDLNKKELLFSQGMLPVFKIVPGHPKWERITDKPTFKYDHDVFTLSFLIRTPANLEAKMYLAFTYPYSFADLQLKLDTMKNRSRHQTLSKDVIYYMRECLCYSLQNRRLDLITVTSYHNMITTEREIRLKNLFPNPDVLRPHRFKKKVIFVSARVHPGETPSSFVLNGLLNLLMDRDDPVAVILRRKYVFKFIPCLNPDGVVNGNFRTDSKGVDLNRMYLQPTFEEHPTIYATRALLRYYHYGYEREEEDIPRDISSTGAEISAALNEEIKKGAFYWCKKCRTKLHYNAETNESNLDIKQHTAACKKCGEPILLFIDAMNHGDRADVVSGLYLYIDMHAHSAKKGIFMYGNHFNNAEDRIECLLLPKIMSINNHNFHFSTCNFTERNMYLVGKKDGLSKEGCGRVAVYKMTGLLRSYTLECSYNTGNIVNKLPPSIKDIKSSSKQKEVRVPPVYTPQVFEEVGQAIGASILDLTDDNPFTRLPHSEYHTLNGLRDWLRKLYDTGEFVKKSIEPPLKKGKVQLHSRVFKKRRSTCT